MWSTLSWYVCVRLGMSVSAVCQLVAFTYAQLLPPVHYALVKQLFTWPCKSSIFSAKMSNVHVVGITSYKSINLLKISHLSFISSVCGWPDFSRQSDERRCGRHLHDAFWCSFHQDLQSARGRGFRRSSRSTNLFWFLQLCLPDIQNRRVLGLLQRIRTLFFPSRASYRAFSHILGSNTTPRRQSQHPLTSTLQFLGQFVLWFLYWQWQLSLSIFLSRVYLYRFFYLESTILCYDSSYSSAYYCMESSICQVVWWYNNSQYTTELPTRN